jgi:hypothetical protein
VFFRKSTLALILLVSGAQLSAMENPKIDGSIRVSGSNVWLVQKGTFITTFYLLATEKDIQKTENKTMDTTKFYTEPSFAHSVLEELTNPIGLFSAGYTDSQNIVPQLARTWLLTGERTIDINGKKIPYISETYSLNKTIKAGLLLVSLAYGMRRALAKKSRTGGYIAGLLTLPTIVFGATFILPWFQKKQAPKSK